MISALKTVHHEHDSFEAHAKDVVALLSAGNLTDGIKLGEKIDAEAEKLDHEVEAILKEIETFTSQAAIAAEAHEKAALRWVIIASAVTIISIAVLAFLVVTKSIVRAAQQCGRFYRPADRRRYGVRNLRQLQRRDWKGRSGP